MNVPIIRLVLACLCFFRPLQTATAETPETSFARVYGVLQRACFECHDSKKQEGDLRLDRRSELLQSASIVAGDPEASELLRRITLPKGHDEVMPAIGDPLSKTDVGIIRDWISKGANWPETFRVTKHWSYVAPVRPPTPASSFRDRPNWARNEIDYFVGKKLQEAQLEPSVEGRPETLVRRLFLDLIGLPPTPDEVNAFARAPTEEAYQQVITDLLSRPQFGERWARPWLDLSRYADSHGFQRDNFRDIWAYRDWVIRALNKDMPFDRFTIEQLAGDLLPNATESQKIATGFHRCTPTNVEAGSLPEETRIEQVIDRVNTTGAVWLGTTLECCQCHDHKYDPFSANDYYGLLAFFNNTEAEADRTNPKKPSSIAFKGPKMVVANSTKDVQRVTLSAKLKELTSEQKTRNEQLAADTHIWADQFAITLKTVPTVHPLSVVSFKSLGADDPHQLLDDGSILLSGKSPPETDEYTVTVRGNASDVTAFRLDALTHESLPGAGPGRGDVKRRNFVLNRFTAMTDNAAELKFSSAIAGFSQKNWDVSGALNSKHWLGHFARIRKIALGAVYPGETPEPGRQSGRYVQADSRLRPGSLHRLLSDFRGDWNAWRGHHSTADCGDRKEVGQQTI